MRVQSVAFLKRVAAYQRSLFPISDSYLSLKLPPNAYCTCISKGFLKAPAMALCGINYANSAAVHHTNHLPDINTPKAPLGIVGLPGALSPKDLKELALRAINQSEVLIDRLLLQPISAKDTVQTLDVISNELCKVGDAAELLRNVHPDAEWRHAASQVIDEIGDFLGRVNIDNKLYYVLETSRKSSEALTEEERIVIISMCKGMEQQGVHMDETIKNQYLELMAAEARLSHEIVASPRDDTNGVWIPQFILSQHGIPVPSSLPTNFTEKQFMKERDKKVLVYADSSVGQLAMQLVRDPDIRKSLFYRQRESNNVADAHLTEFLQYRQQLAHYRGYSNWNAFAQREGILQSPDSVQVFLNHVFEKLKPGVAMELQLLLKHKKVLNLPDSDVLYPWDIQFLKLNYKRTHFGAIENNPNYLLPLSTLLNGVQALTKSLFGLDLVREPALKEEVWHGSVLKFQLRDPMASENSGEAKLLGVLYLDLFSRGSKTNLMAQYTVRSSKNMDYMYHKIIICASAYGALMSAICTCKNLLRTLMKQLFSIFNVQNNVYLDESNIHRQSACTTLVASFSFPLGFSENSAELKEDDVLRLLDQTNLTPFDALILFHEIGHTLHALISSTELQHLSGTRGAADFAEFPSHLFEHFFYGTQFPSRATTVNKGGALLRSVREHKTIKNLFSHMDAMQLLLEAELDQAFYSFLFHGKNSTDLLQNTTNSLYDSVEQLKQHLQNHFSNPKFQIDFYSHSNYPLNELLGISIPSKFMHLIHYGGIYYCYLFCRVSSSLIWKYAFDRSCSNTAAGALLRKTLERGSLDCSILPIVNLVVGKSDISEEIKQMFQQVLESPETLPLEPFLQDLQIIE